MVLLAGDGADGKIEIAVFGGDNGVPEGRRDGSNNLVGIPPRELSGGTFTF